MSFEVDRSSAWAHIALCADITWASEPPDDFIIANQRLLAQHCRISQVLSQEESSVEPLSLQTNLYDTTDKRVSTCQNQENAKFNARKSVKEVIPESRLAQFYGKFYYDDAREKCYTSTDDKLNARGYNSQGCDNPDLTECWMLPEVEYWFRKLVEEPSDRSVIPRRRRQYRMLAEDDFGRWGPSGERDADEAALAARVRSVRPLWETTAHCRAPSPPPMSRKIRARRRQPRRVAALAPPPPPPAYCLEAPAQLLCDPSCKFHFDPPRLPQLTECQRAIGRLSASVQAVIRANAARCPLYRGTNVSRYAPTSQRPRGPDRRPGVWWPRDHPSPRLDHRFNFQNLQRINNELLRNTTPKVEPDVAEEPVATENAIQEQIQEKNPDLMKSESPNQNHKDLNSQEPSPEQPNKTPEKDSNEKITFDDQTPSTSTAVDNSIRKKRLYSTVLSTSAPLPMNLSQVGCVRLSQKFVTPGLIKLNPKIVLSTARTRHNVDNKFEELEKEALEQYKASDESIDTKFRELENQAVEQYSNSNSNTSCSSGNSAEKKGCSTIAENENNNQQSKFHKEKVVDRVVTYSQNFPDLKVKPNSSNGNLKNFHTPPRGEKKEQPHRMSKSSSRNIKNESQKAASDTDYEAREANTKGSHKGPMRSTLHAMPPKKRHMTFCVSDFSSDEEIEEASRSIKDAGPRIKNRLTGKIKMSAHGGGDLNPVMRKT